MRRDMIPLSEVENMMEEKDSKITDLEEKVEALIEDVREFSEKVYANYVEKKVPVREQRSRVLELLQFCSNALENKVLFPTLAQTEVLLMLNLGKDESIERNASFLIREIMKTIEENK